MAHVSGPKGLWCRFCGKYQSIRNGRQVTLARRHMQDCESKR